MKILGNRSSQLFLAACFILTLVIAAFRLLVFFDKPAPTPQQTIHETKMLENSNAPKAPPAMASGHAAEASHHSESEVAAQAYLSDPEVRKKRSHSNRIAIFMRSPARDTPECRKILKILLDNGHPIESLSEVYEIVYKIGSLDSERSPSGAINGQPYDPNNPAHVEFSNTYRKRETDLARIRLDQMKYSTEEIDSILAVNPKISYGHVGAEISLQGVRTDYTDEDLLKYISEHPASP